MASQASTSQERNHVQENTDSVSYRDIIAFLEPYRERFARYAEATSYDTQISRPMNPITVAQTLIVPLHTTLDRAKLSMLATAYSEEARLANKFLAMLNDMSTNTPEERDLNHRALKALFQHKTTAFIRAAGLGNPSTRPYVEAFFSTLPEFCPNPNPAELELMANLSNRNPTFLAAAFAQRRAARQALVMARYAATNNEGCTKLLREVLASKTY